MACDGVIDTSRALHMRDVANLWLSVGGTETNLRAALAVAYAESKNDPYATSITCNTGIFQITPNDPHWGNHSIEELYNARLNVGLAVQNSGNGTNWEEWDVAYAAGERLTRRYPIPFPEAGSAADFVLSIVDAVVPGLPGSAGGVSGPVGPATPGGEPPAARAAPEPPPYPTHYPPQLGPVGPNEIQLPPIPTNRSDDWDNLRYYLSDDLPYLVHYDEYLIESLQHA